jgi:exopolysaccharide biosynthesis polyprenyl glycosylphosphotransferase
MTPEAFTQLEETTRATAEVPPVAEFKRARTGLVPLRKRFSITEELGPARVRFRDALYKRALGAADVLAAGSALVAAVILPGEDQLTLLAIMALPLVVLVSKVIGLYDRDELVLHKITLEETPATFQLATLYAFLVWLFEDAFIQGTLERRQVLGLWIAMFLALICARAVARRIAGFVAAEERCLVVGDDDAAETVRRKLAVTPRIKASVVGQVDVEGRPGTGRGLAAESEDIAALVNRLSVDRVIIAPRSVDTDEILDAIRAIKAVGVKVSVLPRIFEVVGSSVEFDDLGGLTVLGVRRFGLSRSSQLVKRGFDMVGASTAILLLAPVFALVALAIRMDSRGPLLFRQLRVGRDGEQFWMLKFRTMIDGADQQKAELVSLNEADGLFKIANDPRITAVGGFLRKTSLDELPQLFNVLRGEMSLVGPRPLVYEEDARIEGFSRRRLDVTPGMTGAWQVLGSSRIPMHDMITIDYLYRANWSLWLDVKILLRTVPHVLRRRGM